MSCRCLKPDAVNAQGLTLIFSTLPDFLFLQILILIIRSSANEKFKNTIFVPCEQSEQGGSKFNMKKKYTHTPVYGVKEFVCLSVYRKIWPQLSQDWWNRIGWNFFRISLSTSVFSAGGQYGRKASLLSKYMTKKSIFY